MKIKRLIISGGGTGGHIFPALAIAKELQEREPNIELLFVGAKGRMEMEKIPLAGYKIKGLWIDGFQRKISFRNLLLPFKLFYSLLQSFWIIYAFKPDAVVGTGGFASGPLLWIASMLKYPTLIQEQNSYPGITNKLLSKKVLKICSAYSNLERYFPLNKVVMTGNPIRKDILEDGTIRRDSYKEFNLDVNKKTVLIVGGSLGAPPINEEVLNLLDWFIEKDIQLLWQTGKNYNKKIQSIVKDRQSILLVALPFISNMNAAYSVADVIVSRAGALAISELCVVGKPVILIPSPYVSEDHQTKNAKFLAERNAAFLLEQFQIHNLKNKIAELLILENSLKYSSNIKELARPDATHKIVDEIFELI